MDTEDTGDAMSRHIVPLPFTPAQFVEMFPRMTLVPGSDTLLMDTKAGRATYQLHTVDGHVELRNRGNVAEYVIIRLAGEVILNQKELSALLNRHLKANG